MKLNFPEEHRGYFPTDSVAEARGNIEKSYRTSMTSKAIVRDGAKVEHVSASLRELHRLLEAHYRAANVQACLNYVNKMAGLRLDDVFADEDVYRRTAKTLRAIKKNKDVNKELREASKVVYKHWREACKE